MRMMEGSALTGRVFEIMREKALVLPGETVLVAVSGGADSMALLCLLWGLRGALEVDVQAAHFEHGIRGEASLADARFVKAFCEQRGIAVTVGSGDVPALSAAWRCGIEDAARRARYAFLDQTAKNTGAQRIALAHQLEDQAETLMLHLVRGCGLDGLRAMRHLSENRIRPLLDVSRAELENYLRETGVSWREDQTNLDTAYARNLLRQSVFPLLKTLNPRVAEAMARTAQIAGEASDRLHVQSEAALSGRIKRMPYGAFWLLGETVPTVEAARAFARRAGVDGLELRHAKALAALLPGRFENLPSGWRALRTASRLHLLRGDWRPRSDVDPADFQWATGDGLGDGVRAQAFDADAVAGAVFRTRRNGDVFAPLGREGTQKLKQTLRDAGVDRPFRDLLPVLAKESRVLWIVGLKPSRDAAVGPGTKKTVRLRYTGDLPWEIQTMRGSECTPRNGGMPNAQARHLTDV